MSDIKLNILEHSEAMESAVYYFRACVNGDDPETADSELDKMEKALEAIKVNFVTFRNECVTAEKARKMLVMCAEPSATE